MSAVGIIDRMTAPESRISSVPRQSFLSQISGFSVEFGPSRKDVLNFTSQMAVMIKAGMSLPESMESIAIQCDNKKFRKIILDMVKRIEGGESFSQALSRYAGVFGQLYINMVAAAELSGSLSMMLRKLADYIDEELQTRSQVIGAMVYPAIIAFMAVSCTTFLLIFVLPRFTAIFAGKEHLLPKPTVIIMAISSFLKHYWPGVLAGIAVAIGCFIYGIRTKTGRFWWDRIKLTLPLMKTLCSSLYIARSLHAMGVLVNAGVPILDTLVVTAQVSGNVHYKAMWYNVHTSVKQGKKISQSFGPKPLLPSSAIQMIRSGEESGSLGQVLEDVSEFYSRQLKTTIKLVTSMIEPIMIIMMGLLVGFIAMAIILPIFKMSTMMGH
ncbi:MAG: type II secretion system F family protein [Phycisphaerae bacterium]|nr:type II secretion system F family protein [Phycisphaerae bacterium]